MTVRPTHPACLETPQLLEQCHVQRTRRGGPGGSHRNKVETAIQLTHTPTGVIASGHERRSQPENLKVALSRLRVTLAVEQRGYFDLRHVPSERWRSRLDARARTIRVNPKHAEFPCILAEAMDVLAALAWDPTRAAGLLDCTTSQLIKLLKSEPRALLRVNEARAARQAHPLK